MITVGRLGLEQKNTEMLLDALDRVDLKDWKIMLVGPCSEEFQRYADDFFSRNPDKKRSVEFTGMITDKKQLWSIYNDAKVFILTSKSEGSPNVHSEAFRFRNYMVSTDVGACRDLFGSAGLGESIPQKDLEGLATVLQDIVDGKRDIDVYEGCDVTSNSWESILARTNPLLK